MSSTADELLNRLDADDRSRDLEALLSDAFIQLIKEQAVKDFLTENDITCPHCNHDITLSNDSSKKTVSTSPDSNLDDIDPEELEEAKELLQEINSWSEEEVQQLPKKLQRQAQKYQEIISRKLCL